MYLPRIIYNLVWLLNFFYRDSFITRVFKENFLVSLVPCAAICSVEQRLLLGSNSLLQGLTHVGFFSRNCSICFRSSIHGVSGSVLFLLRLLHEFSSNLLLRKAPKIQLTVVDFQNINWFSTSMHFLFLMTSTLYESFLDIAI